MSNFTFLKKNNENLFKIISEAEKLFTDEYFEQTMVQTRRFAENLCKDLLQEKALPDDTFDSMIQKIKDNSFGNTRMQEFWEDLYFLKKHGNNSAHSANTAKDGKIALECLERAFEISVFYTNIKYGYDKKLDKEIFSEEMLMTGGKTGKKSSPKTLKEKYSKELSKERNSATKLKPKSKTNAKTTKSKPNSKLAPSKKTAFEKSDLKRFSLKKTSKKYSKKKKKNSKTLFWIIVIFIIIALLYWSVEYYL